MSTPSIDSASAPIPSTTSADVSTASSTITSTMNPSSSPSASSVTAASLTSDATSSTSASLIDESDDYDDSVASADDTTNIALRKTKRKSSLTHTSSTSTTAASSATTADSILRGFTLRGKAVQSTLSKGLSVALQYTKEKIGQASDVTQEEDSFTQHIDYTRTTAAHLKSLTITLQSLIASQQTAILAHDAFAAAVKKVGSRAAVPVLTTPRSGARLDSGSGGLAAIEEMTAAFTEGSPAASASKIDEGTEDEKTVEGKVNEDSSSASSALSGLTIQPSAAPTSTASAATSNLVPSFYPYTRRHLSGRLIVSDSYASLLNSIQTLQAASVKVALAAINQLEIDRLHYDACQNSLRLLTSTANSASTPTTPHPSDPTLSDDKRRLEHEQWVLKVDSAHLTYLRSKASVEERVDELRVKVRDVLERGLSVIVAIERYEVEAARALLSDEVAGKELSVRKKTNPAAMGIRRSGGQDQEDQEVEEEAVSSTAT